MEWGSALYWGYTVFITFLCIRLSNRVNALERELNSANDLRKVMEVEMVELRGKASLMTLAKNVASVAVPVFLNSLLNGSQQGPSTIQQQVSSSSSID